MTCTLGAWSELPRQVRIEQSGPGVAPVPLMTVLIAPCEPGDEASQWCRIARGWNEPEDEGRPRVFQPLSSMTRQPPARSTSASQVSGYSVIGGPRSHEVAELVAPRQ